MAGEFDGDLPAAQTSTAGTFDDLPKAPNGKGAFDDLPEAKSTPTDDKDLPQLTQGHPKGVLTKLRESLSPLIGPTEDQKLSESVPWGTDKDGNTIYAFKPLGDKPAQMGLFPAMSRPAVPIPKATHNADDGVIMAASKAVYNTAAGFGEFMESPLGVATLGTGDLAAIPKNALPATKEAIEAYRLQRNLQRVVTAGFAADMTAKLPAAAAQAGETSVTGNLGQKIEADLGVGAQAVMAGSLADHATGASGFIADKLGANPTPFLPEDMTAGKLNPPINETGPVKTTDGKVSEFDTTAAAPAPGVFDDLPNATPAAPVQTSGQAVPAPIIPETKTDVAESPVLSVPAEQIATRPDLMQFKRMDDADTGVNANDKLAGKWDDLKAGNLLLWEPNDPAQYGLQGGEKYIVANGHHRFEFGQSQDVPAFNAQVVKESEGYSAEAARTLAAEINIADGKGTIYDQVKFLRNESAAHGTDEALARAGRIGVKGRQAAAIAFHASPDLYTSFVNEQVKPDTAETIARSAPAGSENAEALQRLGIRKAAEGSSPTEVANLIQAVRLEGKSVPAQQFDLFAADDGAIKTAETLAGVASRIQGELTREIRSTDAAAKNATTARAKGVTFDRPPEEILAENAKLKGERDRWDNWALHPDLVQQVRDYAALKRSTDTGGKPETPPKVETPAATPKTLDEKLQGLKFDTEGKLFEGVTSLPIHLWNAAIDVVRLGVKAGKHISAAIEDGIGWLKQNHPGVGFDEQQFRDAVNEKYGVREFGQKLQADPAVSPQAKAQVGEYVYEKRQNETDLAAAQRLVQAHGLDSAITAFKDHRVNMPGAVRTALGKYLIKTLGDQERLARSKGDSAAADALVDKQVDVTNHELKRSTDMAQGLQAMSLYGQMTPEGMLAQAKKIFSDAADTVMGGLRGQAELVRKAMQKGNDAALQGTIRDPEVNRAAEAAVNEAVENSAATRNGVVVEVTGAFAESPEIVRQAREQLGGELNRILQKQGVPVGTRSKAELSAMLDDVAKRAAGIAAGHYQGAELGKPLSVKLQERLGLSEAAANRLAKQLDTVFASMVKKAQERLPWRIANERAKMLKPFDPNEINAPAVDRVIRQQLTNARQNLGKLVQQHGSTVDATGKSIGERVVRDSGLTGPKADALQAAFDQRFQELATAAKKSELERLLKIGVRVPAKLRSAVDDLVKFTNLGAFSDSGFYDALAKKLNLPALTPDLAREITRRANDMQALPEGFQRDRAATQLMNFIGSQRPLKIWERPLAVWYANVLSGFTTPIHIMFDNLGELAGNTAVALLRQPSAGRNIGETLGRGVVKGALQSAEILRSGVTTGVKSQVHTSGLLEQHPFTGVASPLNVLKYVGRGLSAAHVLAFKPAWELRQALAAHDVARQEGLSGGALRQRVADLLGNTEVKADAAQSQAAAEGLKGLDLRRRTGEILEQQREQAMPGVTDNARDYALRSTYLNDPYGALGHVVNGLNMMIAGIGKDHATLGFVPRMVVPFTRIVGNIINEKLNWSPVGAFRALRAWQTGELYGKPISDARAPGDLMTKSIMGTVAVSALATAAAQYLNDPDPKFAITGNGPASPEARKQLMAAGWHPHSIKLGDTYVDYQRTPGAIALAVVGNYMDALKYRHLDQSDALTRTALVLKGTGDTIVHQSFLDSIAKLFESVGNENTKTGGEGLARWAAQAGSRLIVPNVISQVDRFFDPTRYDDTGAAALLRAQVPFIRRMNKPAVNVLGEPVQSPVFGTDFGKANPDALWKVLSEQQAWIPEPNRETIVGDKSRGPDYYRTLTPDELYDYTVESGQRIRDRLTSKLDRIASVEPAQAKKLVDQVTEEQRKATLKMFGP